MPDERTEKMKAVDLAMSQIEKQFGKGAIMRMGGSIRTPSWTPVPSGNRYPPTGSGVRVYPRERVIEISTGILRFKTTLSIHAIAEAQKLGGTAAHRRGTRA